MRIHSLLRNLAAGGMLLCTACSDDGDRSKEPSSGETLDAGGLPSAGGGNPGREAGVVSAPNGRDGDSGLLNPWADSGTTFFGIPIPGLGGRTVAETICADSGPRCTKPAGPMGQQPSGVLEVQVTNTPNRKEGEPTIAANPKDPNNLVMMYANFAPGSVLSKDAYGCNVQYSMDRGATWTRG